MDNYASFPSRWQIGFFTDEVADSLGDQISFARGARLNGLDLRNLNGHNVISLTQQEANEVAGSGLSCFSVASPVNKVHLDWSLWEGEKEKLRQALEAARKLGGVPVRIFSPEIPAERANDDREEIWTDVKKWMAPMVLQAETAGIALLHENDAHFYGAYPQNAKRLFAEFGGPSFQAVFDFANTVLIGFSPLRDWQWIFPHLGQVHIKDALYGEQKIVPAGQGDGQMVEFLRDLANSGWSGPLSLEPHLSQAEAFFGKTAPDLAFLALDSLKEVLSQVGLQ
ncbi:MAG: sugar phosphate isomerase/epimerase [Fimbriimonadaceae bacterium]|nr:sugar phosphate isomerase/epimerase [Fimbriimonadaceae bacterium]